MPYTVKDRREMFQAVRRDLPEIVREIAIETQEEIKDLNRKQLFEGKRPDGTDITPDYTPLTKFLKAERGQPFDRVTLLDEGDFYREIELKFEGAAFNMESADAKAPKIEGKYGDVTGLSEDSAQEYRDNTLHGRVKEEIRERTDT